MAEATPGRCPPVQWALAASAVVSAAATRASTADVDGEASEEEVLVAEVASGAVVVTSAVAIETDTAHRATRPLDLASTEEMVVMATEVIAATAAAVTAEAIEALVGMIREAAAAHMTTDTAAAAAVATATAADSETATTDVPEATWSPSDDEKVGIATGTGTTTGPATMMVAGNVVMTVVTRIQGSCADTKAVSPLPGLFCWWVVDSRPPVI